MLLLNDATEILERAILSFRCYPRAGSRAKIPHPPSCPERAAAAMARLLTSLLFGVSSFDPVTFVGGSVIFLAVAAVAAIIPALKAARIPPAVALQST